MGGMRSTRHFASWRSSADHLRIPQISSSMSRRSKAANLERAAELYAEGLTVREVAKELGISKSNAQRLRKQAIEQGLFEAVQ